MKKMAAGLKRRPGGGPQHKPKKPKQMIPAKKQNAERAPPPKSVPVSGDTDDFEYMLNEMEDYRPPAADMEGSDGGVEGEPLLAGLGSDGEGVPGNKGFGSNREGDKAGGEEAAAGKKSKKRRKRGQKLSALEFEASRQLAKQMAECSGEEQADWLWASYQQHAAASALERGGLTADGVVSLPAQGSLEERLKALHPSGAWQQQFCNRGGSGSTAAAAGQQQQQRQGGPGEQQRLPGSPSLLLVSPSAIGAVGLIKMCPQLNKACRIGKLFAKHMKVPEQEELLRTQVMCIAAGTPNRLCKLADSGALQLDWLKHVVLDCALDVKQRDLLAIPETRVDWWTFYERHLKQRLAAGTLKLCLVNSDRMQ